MTKALVRNLPFTDGVIRLEEANPGDHKLWWNPWSKGFAVWGQFRKYQQWIDDYDPTLGAILRQEVHESLTLV